MTLSRMDALHAEFLACERTCLELHGVEKAACEIDCVSEPDDKVWNWAQHVARHKYGLKGRDAFIFSYGLFLGAMNKEYHL